jgi:hypothetical protein
VKTPAGKFLPGTGQHTAILTIPSELEGLKPHELHRSVRVDTKGSHRLVAKAKLPAWPGPKHRGSKQLHPEAATLNDTKLEMPQRATLRAN